MSQDPADIARVVFDLHTAAWPRLVATAAGLWLLQFLVARGRPWLRSTLVAGFLLTAIGAGLAAAWSIKWLCDDAYISFSYAQRWVQGFGLVLNPGERVEGYTNFLWTMALALAGAVGLDIPRAALFGCLASFVALVVGTFTLTNPLRQREGGLPLAAATVALSRPFTTFATSGLETEFALALCLWAVVCWNRRRLVLAGLLFGLGALARPDHLALAGATWAVALVEALFASDETSRVVRLKRTALEIAKLAFPTLAVFGFYWALRWAWYGEFAPNTFLAKSGASAYWSQGLVYLAHSFLASAGVLAVPFVIGGALVFRRDPQRRSLIFLSVAVALTHGLYVVRVGGDFMEFRFLLPTLLFLAVAFEVVTGAWLARAVRRLGAPQVTAVLVAGCWAALVAHVKPIGPWEKRWHLAAEETFYQCTQVWPDVVIDTGVYRLGHALRRELGDLEPKIRVATGCIGMVAYYSQLPIVDTLGLTSRVVAKEPVTVRSRPGHEKHASIANLREERVELTDGPSYPDRAQELRYDVEGTPFYVFRHTPRLEAHARAKGRRYPDIREMIRSDLNTMDRTRLQRHRRFYASFLEGTDLLGETLAEFDQRLRAEPPTAQELARLSPAAAIARLRQAESFSVAEVVAALKGRVLFRRDFEEDEPQPDLHAGDIWPPSAGTARDQGEVTAFQGQRLVNTYREGDQSTGRLEWRLPAVSGELQMLVGGGSDCSRVFAAVFDQDQEVARFCGRNDEVLRPVQVPLAGLVAPRLVLVDESTDAWGHLLLDDVVVMSPPAAQ